MNVNSGTLMASYYRAVSVKIDKKGKLIRHKAKMSKDIDTIKAFVPSPGTIGLGIYEVTNIQENDDMRQIQTSSYTYRGFDILCFDGKPEYLMVDIMAKNDTGCEFHGSRESLVLALDYIDAYRFKNPAKDDVPVCNINMVNTNEYYAIIHTDDNLTHYLAWQNPAWDDSGYFWTTRETFMKVLRNSTNVHPFIFPTKDMAYAWLRNSGIRKRCKLAKIKVKPGTVLNDPEEPGEHCYPGISADIEF